MHAVAIHTSMYKLAIYTTVLFNTDILSNLNICTHQFMCINGRFSKIQSHSYLEPIKIAITMVAIMIIIIRIRIAAIITDGR